MCNKCAELDDKIQHYQRMANYVTDRLTLDGIKGLIDGMKAQKQALHVEHKN